MDLHCPLACKGATDFWSGADQIRHQNASRGEDPARPSRRSRRRPHPNAMEAAHLHGGSLELKPARSNPRLLVTHGRAALGVRGLPAWRLIPQPPAAECGIRGQTRSARRLQALRSRPRPRASWLASRLEPQRKGTATPARNPRPTSRADHSPCSRLNRCAAARDPASIRKFNCHCSTKWPLIGTTVLLSLPSAHTPRRRSPPNVPGEGDDQSASSRVTGAASATRRVPPHATVSHREGQSRGPPLPVA